MTRIGCDIIEIERIKRSMENEDFLKRFFSAREQVLFQKKNFAPQTVAGNFAAKEAVVKALGTGFTGIGVADVEILRDESGQPILANQALRDRYHCSISISHCETYAMAVAALEKKE